MTDRTTTLMLRLSDRSSTPATAPREDSCRTRNDPTSGSDARARASRRGPHRAIWTRRARRVGRHVGRRAPGATHDGPAGVAPFAPGAGRRARGKPGALGRVGGPRSGAGPSGRERPGGADARLGVVRDRARGWGRALQCVGRATRSVRAASHTGLDDGTTGGRRASPRRIAARSSSGLAGTNAPAPSARAGSPVLLNAVHLEDDE